MALLAKATLQARAAPGPEAACKALAARVEQAVNLKKQGTAAEKAVAEFSALPIGDAVPDRLASGTRRTRVLAAEGAAGSLAGR